MNQQKSPPNYADLGAVFLRKINEYKQLSGKKTKTEKTQAVENEIAVIVARRGLIRRIVETVNAAIANAGIDAASRLERSAIEFSARGMRYLVYVDQDSTRPEVGARAIMRTLRQSCNLKGKWEPCNDGAVLLSLKKNGGM